MLTQCPGHVIQSLHQLGLYVYLWLYSYLVKLIFQSLNKCDQICPVFIVVDRLPLDFCLNCLRQTPLCLSVGAFLSLNCAWRQSLLSSIALFLLYQRSLGKPLDCRSGIFEMSCFLWVWVFKLSTVIVVLVSEVFLLYLYCLYQVITPSTNFLSVYKMWTVFGHRWQGRRCTSFPNFVKFTVIWITNCQQLPAFRARVNATGCGRYFLSFIKLPVFQFQFAIRHFF